MEEEEAVKKDSSLKGKSREEMDLNPFSGTVIKSVLAGKELYADEETA
ncbi:hypothetical protein A2U01_0064329, partial [Trifolium medium]|nr:hypothetical protein [Trifolium medium]